MEIAQEQRTVFVLGVCPRSGTNMAARLLCLHPDADLPEGVWEDYLLANGDDLIDYVDRCEHWWSQWGFDSDDRSGFIASLGAGVEDFLAQRSGARITVTKTPRVHNLEFLPQLFPNAPAFVMVRDGRSTVESLMKTFDRTFDEATLTWRDGMRTLKRSLMQPNVARQVRVIRYEDLHGEMVDTLTSMLETSGLDPARFDMDEANSMPIFGSSELSTTDEVHWQPVEKTDGFDPTKRFAHWTQAQHDRFRWLAGEEQMNFGYEISLDREPKPSEQRLLDAKHNARAVRLRPELAPAKRLVKRALGKPIPPADYPRRKGWRD